MADTAVQSGIWGGGSDARFVHLSTGRMESRATVGRASRFWCPAEHRMSEIRIWGMLELKVEELIVFCLVLMG